MKKKHKMPLIKKRDLYGLIGEYMRKDRAVYFGYSGSGVGVFKQQKNKTKKGITNG